MKVCISKIPTSLYFCLLITEGEFGIVYRGLLYQDEIPKVVAVKTLKGTSYNRNTDLCR